MKPSNSLKDLFSDDPYYHESLVKIRAGDEDNTTKGTGECMYVGCSCKGYADDGSGLYKCTCGHRKMDHSSY